MSILIGLLIAAAVYFLIGVLVWGGHYIFGTGSNRKELIYIWGGILALLLYAVARDKLNSYFYDKTVEILDIADDPNNGISKYTIIEEGLKFSFWRGYLIGSAVVFVAILLGYLLRWIF